VRSWTTNADNIRVQRNIRVPTSGHHPQGQHLRCIHIPPLPRHHSQPQEGSLLTGAALALDVRRLADDGGTDDRGEQRLCHRSCSRCHSERRTASFRFRVLRCIAAPRANEPVNKGLAFYRLYMAVLSQVHKRHAALIEEPLVTFNQDHEISRMLEGEPGSAVSDRLLFCEEVVWRSGRSPLPLAVGGV
jgi:hypothetical protein